MFNLGRSQFSMAGPLYTGNAPTDFPMPSLADPLGIQRRKAQMPPVQMKFMDGKLMIEILLDEAL